MVDISYDGVSYSIKNDVSELNIGEYEKITYMLNGSEDFYDRWFNVLEFLGLPRFVIDEIDAVELIEIINSINVSESSLSYVKEIEIDGYIYKCDVNDMGEPIIKGRAFKMLEKFCKKDYYASYIMAILFKRVDLTNTEHFDDAHIEHKASLFRKLDASIYIPYMILIGEKYIKSIKSLG